VEVLRPRVAAGRALSNAGGGVSGTLFSWIVLWNEGMGQEALRRVCAEITQWEGSLWGGCTIVLESPLAVTAVAMSETGIAELSHRYRYQIATIEQDFVVGVAGADIVPGASYTVAFESLTGYSSPHLRGMSTGGGGDGEYAAQPGSTVALSGEAGDALGALSGLEVSAQELTKVTRSTEVLGSEAPLWGLDRLDQDDLPGNGTITQTTTGRGVQVYILDTGMRLGHDEFKNASGNSRVTEFYCKSTDSMSCDDQNQHGTHVAGTAGGTNVGVAPMATLNAVKVMDKEGLAPLALVIDALSQISTKHPLGVPGVLNLSLGVLGTVAVEHYLFNAMADRGILTVVAAGNDGTDSCKGSYPKVFRTLSVGATDSADTIANFSNYGTCVDVFAPGTDIYSACGNPELCGTSNKLYVSQQGTSMAAPHVAGVAALFFEHSPDVSPDSVSRIVVMAGQDRVKGHKEAHVSGGGDPSETVTQRLLNLNKIQRRVFKARVRAPGSAIDEGFPYTNVVILQEGNYTISLKLDLSANDSAPTKDVELTLSSTDPERFAVTPATVPVIQANAPNTVLEFTVAPLTGTQPRVAASYVDFRTSSADPYYDGIPFAVAVLDRRAPQGDVEEDPLVYGIGATATTDNPTREVVEMSDLNFTFSGRKTCAETAGLFADPIDPPRGPDAYYVFSARDECNLPEYSGCNLYIDTCDSATLYDGTMSIYEYDASRREVVGSPIMQNWRVPPPPLSAA